MSTWNKPGPDEPDWNNPAIRNRKKGDTTFQTCGWCEHRGCGSCRYDCLLSGSCDLLKDYENDVKWDTPCKVIHLGKADIKDIIGSKNWEINNAKNSIKSTEDEIATLKELQKKAKNTPPTPDARDSDHFNVNDRVAVNIDGKWVGGTVVLGYRHHDGCVSYILDGQGPIEYKKLENCFDKKKHPKEWAEHQKVIEKIGKLANAPGCGVGTPCTMLMTEWEYFTDHPDDYDTWITKCLEKVYNGEKLDRKDYPTPKRSELVTVNP